MTDDYRAMAPEPYRPPYPVPPIPLPWWRIGKRLQRFADAQTDHVARLVTLVDLHRQLLASEDRARNLDQQLERCRNWNTALLKEKHAQALEIAVLQERVLSLEQRVDDAAREMLAADKRMEKAREALAQAELTNHGAVERLQRALKRCDDLAAKLRNRRKR